jgi:hypothetical protein
MDNFFRQLAAIVGDEHVLVFLQSFVTDTPRIAMACRHDRFRPDGVSHCFSAGITDRGKAMAMRKSTIFSAAYKFARRPSPAPGSPPYKDFSCSTKVRAHHLFKLASCATTIELQHQLDRITGDEALLHLCGDGICSPERPHACVNPEHTVWGTQAINVRHVGAHEMLQLVQTADEYDLVRCILHRNPTFAGVF